MRVKFAVYQSTHRNTHNSRWEYRAINNIWFDTYDGKANTVLACVPTFQRHIISFVVFVVHFWVWNGIYRWLPPVHSTHSIWTEYKHFNDVSSLFGFFCLFVHLHGLPACLFHSVANILSATTANNFGHLQIVHLCDVKTPRKCKDSKKMNEIIIKKKKYRRIKSFNDGPACRFQFVYIFFFYIWLCILSGVIH